VIAASSLFSISDADNDPLTYFLYDGTAGGGHFAVNGAAVAAQTVVALSASQLAQTTFVAGPAGTTDALSVAAFDGQAYSNNTTFSQFQVSVPVNHAPVVTIPSANVSASAGQVFTAASLFTISDADNDPLTYFLYDGTPNGGHFAVNGVAVADQTVVALSASQLAQTTFVAGPAGSHDDLAVAAFDGQAYSNNTTFSQFHVNVASPSPASPNASATGKDNFVFAPDLGQKAAVDFVRGVADNHALRTDLSADHFNQVFEAGVLASIDAKSAFGIHTEATIDPLALFGLHAADHAHLT
jgi:hypothetical protein